MDSIWEVVLASSVVSTVLSTAIAGVTKIFTEKRQRSVVAQGIARGLEDYARKCAVAARETTAAINLASEMGDYQPLSDHGLIQRIELSLAGLDRLDPVWRDRISAFPEKARLGIDRVMREWHNYYGEPFETAESQLELEVDLGHSAYKLAMEMREAHGLPKLHAEQECKEALEVLDAEDREQELRYQRYAVHNATMTAQKTGK